MGTQDPDSASEERQGEKAIISVFGPMKPEGSSLNPHTNREDSKTVITENSSNDSIGEPHLHNPPFDNLSLSLNTGRGQNAPVAVASSVNNLPARGSVSQDSNELKEGEKLDGQLEQDLRYLFDNFCKLSKDYLTYVYLENERDLKATLDLLKQLEIKPESLPDSLGIGDPSESEFAAVDRPSSLESGSAPVDQPSSLESGSAPVGRPSSLESSSAAVDQPSSLESGSAAVGRPSSKKNVAKGSSSSSKSG